MYQSSMELADVAVANSTLREDDGSIAVRNGDESKADACAFAVEWSDPTWKRVFDIAGAIAGLILLSPLFLLVSLIIRVGTGGPVFFRQERYGLDGEPFVIWKFRTLRTTADQGLHVDYVKQQMQSNGGMTKLSRDAEMVPLGKWMRKLAIDELPQLLNVLTGEMSLVGPRPDVILPADYAPAHRCRFHVKPGMTGLWQVSGKNRTTFQEMMELDARYAHQCSLWLDTFILAKTPWAILGQLLAATS
ncbi:MAG: sugar transferase [Pirellulaceae bacterium]|nr:sugar transferase [Planctomycetales bacterium]